MFKYLLSCFCILIGVCLNAKDLDVFFAEASKSAVWVSYMQASEENRANIHTSGIVADENGLILLPSSEINQDLPLSDLSEFKVFSYNGNPDGYPAKYLGTDKVYGVHFLQLEEALPETMIAYSKFPKANVKLGQKIWGIGISSSEISYKPYLLTSYVSSINELPIKTIMAGEAVSSVGGPIFDLDGNFVAWALGASVSEYTMYLPNNTKIPVSLQSYTHSQFAYSADELDEILKYKPSNPSGDTKAFLGVLNVRILDKKVSEFLNIEKDKVGFVVGDVIEDSSAQKAGIKKADIIVSIDSKSLDRLESDYLSNLNFNNILSKKNVGDSIKLGIIRDDKLLDEIAFTLQEAPKTPRQAQYKYFKRLGFSLREFLFYDAINRRILKSNLAGAVVRFVKQNSPASSATPSALVPFDWIKEINSTPIESYTQAIDILSKIENDESIKELVILAEDDSETKLIKIKLD